MSTFFGLGSNYRPILHNQIFELIYYGKGGFTWSDVYDFPVWLRKFYTKSIEKALKAESEANKKSSKPQSKGLSRPNIGKR
tara:strand:- start:2946 stop:3188 length:243 start_codon:yes stop_codon:yes gene_type:complete